MQGGSEQQPKPGLCWDCNYPLRGIDSRRCPECGREFDPSNPRTMNLGQPRGPIGRWAVRPLSWPLVAAAAVATGLILLVTRPPFWWREGWFIDFRYFWRPGDWKAIWAVISGREIVYLLGILLWTLVIVGWGLGAALRRLALLRYPAGPQGVWRRHVLMLAMMTVSIVAVGLGWPYRLGKIFVRQAMTPSATTAVTSVGRRMYVIWAPGIRAPDQVGRALWAVALEGASVSERLTAMQLLADHVSDQTPWMLKDALCRSSDPPMRVWELRLFALYGPPEEQALVEKYLDDPIPEIRAAAADAVGILHGGLEDSQLNQSSLTFVATASDPPVRWSRSRQLARDGTILQIPRVPLSDALRHRLSDMMVAGATTDEREAAARSLVGDPPPGYRLRLAEWGVWQSQRVENEERLTAQLAQIPPLAHAVGDSVRALSSRTPTTIVWKPVIHLSTNAPVPVDLRVRMLRGRPWYVYPMPDDFALFFRSRGRGSYNLPATRPVVERLDPSALQPIDAQMREGYPWLTPSHLGERRTPGYELDSAGFRWQSLIVSPAKLPWMREAAVGNDPQFAWWKQLRDVESAWLSNRGETERFLYYDGPTMITSPVTFALRDGQLFASPAPRPAYSEPEGVNSRPTWTVGFNALRDALLVRVKDRSATAQRLDVPVNAVSDTAITGRPLPGGAERALAAMLKERGLTQSEAAGMINAWRHTFFETDGTRLLIMMTQSDYEVMCPLSISPAPTEIKRVGVIWVELK